MNIQTPNLSKIVACLKSGGVIAYPTEAVYGLGCDPFNESAVTKILKLKKRSLHKGLILIAHDWQVLMDLTISISTQRLEKIKATWPGPYTWVFPASSKTPKWITGTHDSVALRVTNHPIARTICQSYGAPIVSTSANVEGEKPAADAETVRQYFGDQIDFIVGGEVGDLQQPTTIRDAITDAIIR